MSTSLRVILFVASLCVFFFIMKKIKKAKLKIEYALFWIVSSILLLILSIFPQIAYFFADICGIKSPVNFIFFILVFRFFYRLFM